MITLAHHTFRSHLNVRLVISAFISRPTSLPGRAIAQVVSRRLPTAEVRVRARVWSCGICGGQSGAGARFLRVLRFLLPIFIPPIAPQSPSSIIWGGYNRPVVAAVPSGLSLTPLRIIKKTFLPSSNEVSVFLFVVFMLPD
jgi:hypothetical protein